MIKKHLFLCAAFIFFFTASSISAQTIKTVSFGDLPVGAKDVINGIKSGSTDWPFVKNDGIRFGNREKRLPQNNNASYKEYTVCSDQMKKQLKEGKRPNRGAKRIIHDVKNNIYYYTDDHYKTFNRVVFKDGEH